MLGLFQVCCILTVFNCNAAWPGMVVITVVGLIHTGLVKIWSNFAENNVDFVACCLCGVNIKRGRKNKIFKKQKRLPDRESNPGLPRLKFY